MFRSYFLLNTVLLIIVGFLGFKFYNVLMYPIDIPSKSGAGEVQTDKIAVTREDKNLNEKSFQIIIEKDLFRPSRAAPLLSNETSKKVSTQNLPRLFGTIIINDNKTALLDDPVTKITKSYRINDSVAGFVVLDIQKDKVILLKDKETIKIQLRDGKGYSRGAWRRAQKSKTRRPPRRSPPPLRRGEKPPDVMENEEEYY